MSKFVAINKIDIEKVLNNFKYELIEVKGSKEIVYRVYFDNNKIVDIYTSIITDTEIGRSLGKDAIKLVQMLRVVNGEYRLLEKETHTYRTIGWERRLKKKLFELQDEYIKISVKSLKLKTGDKGEIEILDFLGIDKRITRPIFKIKMMIHINTYTGSFIVNQTNMRTLIDKAGSSESKAMLGLKLNFSVVDTDRGPGIRFDSANPRIIANVNEGAEDL